MELTLQIVQIIAFSALTVLCVTVVFVLVRLQKTLDVALKDFRQVSAKAIPVLANLEAISERLRTLTDTIGEQAEAVKDVIGSFVRIAEDVVAFEQKVQGRLEDPILDAVDTFASIFKGVHAFIDRIPFLGRLRAQ